MAINRYAGLAQLVEHLICNQGVGGSNPSAGTIQKAEAPNPDRPGSHSKPQFEPPTRQSVRTEPQASSLERSESHPSAGTKLPSKPQTSIGRDHGRCPHSNPRPDNRFEPSRRRARLSAAKAIPQPALTGLDAASAKMLYHYVLHGPTPDDGCRLVITKARPADRRSGSYRHRHFRVLPAAVSGAAAGAGVRAVGFGERVQP